MSNSIDAHSFSSMLQKGAETLAANRVEVDELNVFPVPDGDTGTNMSLTVDSAVKEVQKLPKEATIGEIAKALSSGALRGARGNSGVIVSQLFRGMSKALKTVEQLDAQSLAACLTQGVETAYKAVMRPKEGTILTVARGMAEAAREYLKEHDDVVEMFRCVISGGEEILKKTPDMLPVLKEAGVVDAGGKGLLYIYKGMYAQLTGESTDGSSEEASEGKDVDAAAGTSATVKPEEQYAYELTYHISCANAEAALKDLGVTLQKLGDAPAMTVEKAGIQVQMKTDVPGEVISAGTKLGMIYDLQLNNCKPVCLPEQENTFNEEAQKAPEQSVPEERKKFGFIAVSMGDGLTNVFKDLNVDCVIAGGQTMNPSTEDILNAIDQINADDIYILPNNKNIILAAKQAADLITDKNIYVVPTRNVPQGFAALFCFDEEAGGQDNLTAMEEAIVEVHTGMTTYAIRDTRLNDMDIHKDDILGMFDGELSLTGQEPIEVAKKLIDRLMETGKEMFSIYYGDMMKEEQARLLFDYVQQLRPGSEVEICRGGQPLYHFIISVE